MKKSLYDISEVCKMLGTTSRTLRFYEEKGIIKSTTVGTSSRRQYTEEQLTQIKNVLVLRTLGLSVKAILELDANESELKSAVLSKRAEIYASIDSRIREIHLLNEALFALESGKDIFSNSRSHISKAATEVIEIAEICTDAVLNGENDILYRHISPKLAEYMPQEVYNTVRADTFAPLGSFVCIESITSDPLHPNKIYSKVKFSKLGLKITFVFYDGQIHGFWLGYYNSDER